MKNNSIFGGFESQLTQQDLDDTIFKVEETCACASCGFEGKGFTAYALLNTLECPRCDCQTWQV